MIRINEDDWNGKAGIGRDGGDCGCAGSGLVPCEEEILPPLGVTVRDKRAVISSRDVARVFEKEHKNVLRDIRSLECSADFTELNFELSTYSDNTGRKLPEVIITRDGFTILAMGFTGRKAMAFKEAYIAEFNRMERELRGDLDGRAVQALSRIVEHLEERIARLEKIVEGLALEVSKTVTPLPLLCEVRPDPENSPKARQRMRVLHVVEQKPEDITMADWLAQVAEAEDVSVPTIYRWLAEARDGKLLPARAETRFNIQITVGEIRFDSKRKSFCDEAAKWFLKEWAANPKLEVKRTWKKLKKLAEERGWKVGSLASLYRLCKDIQKEEGAQEL